MSFSKSETSTPACPALSPVGILPDCWVCGDPGGNLELTKTGFDISERYPGHIEVLVFEYGNNEL
jgi:hypothetical protein